MNNRKYTFFENKILGKGLTSIVCEGIENKTKEKVAVKIISKLNKLNKIKNFNNYISNEITVLNFLNSYSNIIKLLDFEEDDNQYVLVFEYVPIKFEEIIHSISYNKIFYYVKQLLEILILLKNNNILHNDIKPANILINNDKIKLCDFGMAEFLEGNIDSIKSFVCGSPMYMDLSKINGIHSYETDFWCFKLIYYELLYGHHPFNDIKNTKDLKTKLENVSTDLYNNITFYSDDDVHTQFLKKLFSNEIKTPIELLELMNTVILDKNVIKVNLETNIIKSKEEFSFSEIEESNFSLSAIKISNEISIFNIDECNQFILI